MLPRVRREVQIRPVREHSEGSLDGRKERKEAQEGERGSLFEWAIYRGIGDVGGESVAELEADGNADRAGDGGFALTGGFEFPLADGVEGGLVEEFEARGCVDGDVEGVAGGGDFDAKPDDALLFLSPGGGGVGGGGIGAVGGAGEHGFGARASGGVAGWRIWGGRRRRCGVGGGGGSGRGR